MRRTETQNYKRSYDVAVAYRIYPAVSQAALGLPGAESKYQLAEICLKSFKECLGGVRAKIWVLLDGCPPGYAKLFRKYFDSNDLIFIDLNNVGNQATFVKQIEILLEQADSEVIYFAEDDYFYLPNQFRSMIELMHTDRDVHFITPYDHLDCYTLDLHRTPKQVKAHGGKHWRTASSSCLTFLTTRETLRKTRSVFQKYFRRQSLDCSLWLSLTKQRVFSPFFFGRHLFGERVFCKIVAKSWLYCWRQILFGEKRNLWVPIPGIATHLDRKGLSPNVDWQALVKNQLREIASEAAPIPAAV